jgi:hypothetical protein
MAGKNWEQKKWEQKNIGSQKQMGKKNIFWAMFLGEA